MNSTGKPSRKRRFILGLAIVVIVLGALIAALFQRENDLPNQFTWLTPAEFARVKRVGPLTKVKYTLMNWTAPLWKNYWRNKPQISVTLTVFTLPLATPWPTNAPEPLVITTNGTRVWVLTPEQSKDMETEFVSLSERAILAQFRITTTAEVPGQVTSGNPFGSKTNATFVGSSAFFAPATANGKLVLPIDFSCTQFETNTISGVVSVKTNQAYSCRAVFPNNGGLLIENPNPESGDSNRHWLFLGAKAVDANGRLIGR